MVGWTIRMVLRLKRAIKSIFQINTAAKRTAIFRNMRFSIAPKSVFMVIDRAGERTCGGETQVELFWQDGLEQAFSRDERIGRRLNRWKFFNGLLRPSLEMRDNPCRA